MVHWRSILTRKLLLKMSSLAYIPNIQPSHVKMRNYEISWFLWVSKLLPTLYLKNTVSFLLVVPWEHKLNIFLNLYPNKEKRNTQRTTIYSSSMSQLKCFLINYVFLIFYVLLLILPGKSKTTVFQPHLKQALLHTSQDHGYWPGPYSKFPEYGTKLY